MSAGPTMSLGDHLEDLRRRIILALTGLVPIVVIAFAFGDVLFGLLIAPVRQALLEEGLPGTMQQTGPLETFFTYFRVALIAAALVGAPWIIFQLWKFVAPGLYQHERRFAYLLFPMSLALSLLGVLFMYFVILPIMLHYLVNFGTSIGVRQSPTIPLAEGITLPSFPVLPGDPPAPADGEAWINSSTNQLSFAVKGMLMRVDMGRGAAITQQYRVGEYVDLFLSMMVAFAGGFQTPVVVMLLGWAGIIDRAMMRRYRKHAIIAVCVAAAILTPTGDPITMLLMAVPMYLLYELGGVLFTVLSPQRVAGEKHKEGDVDDETPFDPRSQPSRENPIFRKAVGLVPNTLRSTGLLDTPGRGDAGDRFGGASDGPGSGRPDADGGDADGPEQADGNGSESPENRR